MEVRARKPKRSLKLEAYGSYAWSRLAHTTALVDSWPGAKSLSVLFDINEA